MLPVVLVHQNQRHLQEGEGGREGGREGEQRRELRDRSRYFKVLILNMWHG